MGCFRTNTWPGCFRRNRWILWCTGSKWRRDNFQNKCQCAIYYHAAQWWYDKKSTVLFVLHIRPAHQFHFLPGWYGERGWDPSERSTKYVWLQGQLRTYRLRRVIKIKYGNRNTISRWCHKPFGAFAYKRPVYFIKQYKAWEYFWIQRQRLCEWNTSTERTIQYQCRIALRSVFLWLLQWTELRFIVSGNGPIQSEWSFSQS